MQRHETDWFSLVAGVLALAGGAAFLLGRAQGVHTDAGQIVPVMLLAAGLLGLVSAVARLRRREGPQPTEQERSAEARPGSAD